MWNRAGNLISDLRADCTQTALDCRRSRRYAAPFLLQGNSDDGSPSNRNPSALEGQNVGQSGCSWICCVGIQLLLAFATLRGRGWRGRQLGLLRQIAAISCGRIDRICGSGFLSRLARETVRKKAKPVEHAPVMVFSHCRGGFYVLSARTGEPHRRLGRAVTTI